MERQRECCEFKFHRLRKWKKYIIFFSYIYSWFCLLCYRYIEEEDLLRFLKSEEVHTIFPLFEGAIETGRVTKSSFRNWVVSFNIYIHTFPLKIPAEELLESNMCLLCSHENANSTFLANLWLSRKQMTLNYF